MDEQLKENQPSGAPGSGETRPCIQIERKGPFHVSGVRRLTRRIRVLTPDGEAAAWQSGEDYALPEPTFKLCRCGHSKNKPFCDESHKQIEWEDALTADRALSETRRRVYRGTEMYLTDDESLCAGFAFCDRFGGVWNEIHDTADPTVRERLQHQISLCPSGRLQWKRQKGEAPVEIHYEPMIATIPDGPLWLLGGIEIQGPDGEVYEVRNRELLCRCGLSRNKPFCDGSHWDSGFHAP